jgi:hypothetical protein
VAKYALTQKLNLDLDPKRRIILISDIHGNYDLFTKLLAKVNFSSEDYLFILGDIIEKGHANLKMLDYVMDMMSKGNTYALCGNCENVYREIVTAENPQLLLNYALVRGNSIINEMAERLNIKIDRQTDMTSVCSQFITPFQHYFKFLKSLPHVIETDKFILAHAGIKPDEPNYGLNAYDIMKNDFFNNQDNKFDKWVVVGHFPTINYRNQIPSYNPLINMEKHLINIDGGNNVKSYSQLNAFIINNMDEMKFSFTYVDDYPKTITFKDNKAVNKDSFNIIWGDNKIKILEKFDNYSHCLHLTSNREIDVFNDDIYEYNGDTYCDFASNHELDVPSGVEISILNKKNDKILVKFNGVVGFINKDCI